MNQLTTDTDFIRRSQIGGAVIIVMAIGYSLWTFTIDRFGQEFWQCFIFLLIGIHLLEQARWLKRIERLQKRLLTMAQSAGIDPLADVPGPVMEAQSNRGGEALSRSEGHRPVRGGFGDQ